MSDDAVASTSAAPAAKSPKKKAAKDKKPKKAADHPKYSAMIKDALNSLKERGGSSRQALLKYIMKHYNLGSDEKIVNVRLKLALKAGVKNGSLKQSKGSGASGSFKVGGPETEAKPTKVKKASSPAKPKAKKASSKKAASPKKAVAKSKAKKPAEDKVKKIKAKKPTSPKKPTPAKPKAASKKPKAASPKKTVSPKAKKTATKAKKAAKK
jgi:hypothetical protein